jgi:cytoskeleton-associated protein 5
MLDELFNDSNVPKIKSGDFTGLAKTLKKMMGDANIVVSQTAVKVCGNLAKGLRKDFEPCCRELVPTLIGKYKEKKTQVIDDVNAVLTSFLMCTNMENILSELIASLADKSPLVKK